MASAKVKARLKALRKKFGLGEFKNKVSRPKRTRKAKRKYSGGVIMARRRKSFSRKSSMGLGGINLKGIAIGAGSAFLADQLNVNVPYKPYVAGAVAGKVMKKGILSGVIGAGAYEMLLKGKVSSVTGNSSYGGY